MPAPMLVLVIDADGRVHALDDAAIRPEALGLGTPAGRRRASHVRPARPLPRAAFRLLRALAGDRGRLAAWSRTWPGPWTADMAPSGGPVLGPFDDRAAALAAEAAWLRAHDLGL